MNLLWWVWQRNCQLWMSRTWTRNVKKKFLAREWVRKSFSEFSLVYAIRVIKIFKFVSLSKYANKFDKKLQRENFVRVLFVEMNQKPNGLYIIMVISSARKQKESPTSDWHIRGHILKLSCWWTVELKAILISSLV